MNKKIQTVMGLVLYLLAITAFAKPVNKTPLDRAIALSDVIVIAEIMRHQYDSIVQGGNIQVEDLYTPWQEYKTLKILKTSKNDQLNIGKTLSITNKTNSCYQPKADIKRVGEKLEMSIFFSDDKILKETYLLKKFNQSNGKKVILFLKKTTSSPRPFSHVGWFISPSEYSQEMLKAIEHILQPSGKID